MQDPRVPALPGAAARQRGPVPAAGLLVGWWDQGRCLPGTNSGKVLLGIACCAVLLCPFSSIPHLVFLVCAALLHLLNHLYFDPQVFSFRSSKSLPLPAAG